MNLTICCDAIGNKKRADDYRTQLKARIDRAASIQVRSKDAVRNALYAPTMALIDKTKRSKDDEIHLMESVARMLFTPKEYSGTPEGSELLERVIGWKTQKGGPDNAAMIDDYNSLVDLFVSNRRFDQAEPVALLRIELLQRTKASDLAIAQAKADYAGVLQERGLFALAMSRYLESLPVLLKSPKASAVDVLKNLAYCYQMKDEYVESMKYLKQALAIAIKDSPEADDINVRLGVVSDLMGE